MNTIVTIMLIGSMLFSGMSNANAITTNSSITTLQADGSIRKEVTATNIRGEIVEHYVTIEDLK